LGQGKYLNTFRVISGDAEKNEDNAERNILGWKGLVPLIEIDNHTFRV